MIKLLFKQGVEPESSPWSKLVFFMKRGDFLQSISIILIPQIIS